MSNIILPLICDLEVSESRQQYDLDVVESSLVFDLDSIVNIVAGSVADYDGEYTIIPKVESQSIPCENKRMRSDVTVTEIPYYEVSNVSGLTVYIANSLDD